MLLPDAVTFSRNVFLPITNVCRNRCRYCGFRRDPSHPEANLMTVSEVTKILDAGKRAGCTEALFTFGEMPRGTPGHHTTPDSRNEGCSDPQVFWADFYLTRGCRERSTRTGELRGFLRNSIDYLHEL